MNKLTLAYSNDITELSFDETGSVNGGGWIADSFGGAGLIAAGLGSAGAGAGAEAATLAGAVMLSKSPG